MNNNKIVLSSIILLGLVSSESKAMTTNFFQNSHRLLLSAGGALCASAIYLWHIKMHNLPNPNPPLTPPPPAPQAAAPAPHATNFFQNADQLLLAACGAFFAYTIYLSIKNGIKMRQLSDQELITQATEALKSVQQQGYYRLYLESQELPQFYTDLVSRDAQDIAQFIKLLRYRHPLTTNATLFGTLYIELRNTLEIITEIREKLEQKFPHHD